MSSMKKALASHLRLKGDDAASCAAITKAFLMKYYLLLGIIFVVVFASNVSNIGNKEGPLATHITASWIAVCMIFLVTGFNVKTREFKKAAFFWQLNLFVLFFIFVYHPLIGLALSSLLGEITEMSPQLLDGLQITMCMPCTITGAIVLTSACNGNEAAAVVNCSGSNMLGILVSPALIFVFLGNLGNVDIATVFLKLALRVAVPFTVGQLIRNFGGDKARSFLLKYKPILKKIQETSLLYIIFCAMSESFYNGLDAKAIELVVMFLIVLCIHSSSLALVWNLSGCRGSTSNSEEQKSEERTKTVDRDEDQSPTRIKCKDECMKFSVYDRVAITFCSSHKTAAFGIPIVTSLYEDSDHLGIYLVPLLMYPPIQLIVDSLLVQPLASRVAKWEEGQKEEESSSSKEKLQDKAVPSIVGTTSTTEVANGDESPDVATQV